MINSEIQEKKNRAYKLGELHAFEASGSRFVYVVAGGAIFEIDHATGVLVDVLKGREASRDQLLNDLTSQGIELNDASELLNELIHARLIVSDEYKPEPVAEPPSDFPLQTLVLNL